MHSFQKKDGYGKYFLNKITSLIFNISCICYSRSNIVLPVFISGFRVRSRWSKLTESAQGAAIWCADSSR